MKSGEGIGFDVEGGIGPTNPPRAQLPSRERDDLSTVHPPLSRLSFRPLFTFCVSTNPVSYATSASGSSKFLSYAALPVGLFSKSMPSEPLSPSTTSDGQDNSPDITTRLPVLILGRILFLISFASKPFGHRRSGDRRFNGCFDYTVYVNKFKCPHWCIYTPHKKV